jgi:hypothetical protein
MNRSILIFSRYRSDMIYLWHRIIHRHVTLHITLHITLHVTAVHVVDRHTLGKLRSWRDELRLHRIWVIVLDNPIEWLRTHGSELLSWSPRGALRLRKERRVLRPDVETLGIVSTLLRWLGFFVLARPVFG